MLLPADYHTHTSLCRHAFGRPVDYAKAAKERGLSEIGISDHFPVPHLPESLPKKEYAMDLEELPIYARWVEEAREAFPSMAVRLAFEVDYYPQGMKDIASLLGTFEPDYLYISVHVLEDWCIDDERMIDRYQDVDVQKLCDRYVEALIEAVSLEAFDVLGHLDLYKKFGHRAEISPTLLDALLRRLKRSDMAVEINTAGLRKPCQEMYPSGSLLRSLQEARIPICFGSDAHRPEEVGWRFEQAVQTAKEAGFAHWCRFEGRNRRLVAL